MATQATDRVVSIDEKAGTVTIVLPLSKAGIASKSGKTERVCSTNGGLRTDTMYRGRPVTVNVNAYIPADE